MQANRRQVLYRLAAAPLLLAGMALGPAAAQTAASAPAAAFPRRPVRIVVPYPAGGATDVLARAIAEPLGKQWQRPIVVENKPGASGMIGADAVVKAPPDGHTLLLTLTGVVQVPSQYAKPPFDPLKDLAPVSELATTHLVVTGNADMPASLAGFVAEARRRPHHYSYGTYGTGSGAHLYMEVFTAAAGLDMIHVPYKGEAPLFNDLLGKQVSLATVSPMALRQHLASGKVRPLAVTGSTRSPLLPDVPTFAEQGFAGLDGPGWFGLFAPAGTPAAIVDRVSADVNAVLAGPDIRRRMDELGVLVKGTRPAEFAKVAAADHRYWSALVRKLDLRMD